MARKGWFIIPGVQEGDRTVEEQMCALRLAAGEAQGKRVLDLGCAEALVSIEFAKAGALSVHGIEFLESHLEVARQMCAPYPEIALGQADLNKPPKLDATFDIVLCLGVVHKLYDPGKGLLWAAKACHDLFLLRAGKRQNGSIITAKHRPFNSVDAHDLLRREGFALEQVVEGREGAHKERVEYWRKT